MIVVTDTSDRAALEAAIKALRTKQRRARIQSTRDEIQASIDEILEILFMKPLTPQWRKLRP